MKGGNMEKEGRKLKDWIKDNLDKQQLRDMDTYGIDAGWRGMASYADTSQLYAEFKHEIWEALAEETKALGYSNPLEMILGVFNKESLDKLETVCQFENLLFWHLVKKRVKELVH
jgi:hypothetical protein